LAIPAIGEAIATLDAPDAVKQALTAAAGAAVGAAVGGGSGAAAGLNQTVNNYLRHDDIRALQTKLAGCRSSGDPAACQQNAWKEAAALDRATQQQNCTDASSCRGLRDGVQADWADLATRQAALDQKLYAGTLTESEVQEYAINAQQISRMASAWEESNRKIRVVVPVEQWTAAEKAQTFKDAMVAIGGVGAARAAGSVAKAETAATTPWRIATQVTRDEANALIANRLPTGVKMVDGAGAETLNAKFLADNPGYQPPYLPGSKSVTVRTTEETGGFVRVFAGGSSKQADSWIMRAEDIAGLTPNQIAAKYSLPNVPTMVTNVTLPAGTDLRASVANNILLGKNGGGGGVQFEIVLPKEKINANWFNTPRPLP
jgi:filamentous hemagglutinin